MRLERHHRTELQAADRGAFTLIEILLAISLTVGLMMVAVVFYRQVADLRGQILQESEKLAAVRLLLDRMAADLRTASPGPGSGEDFRGESGSMSFPRWTSETGGGRVRVTFGTVWSNEGTNRVVQGVTRVEDPLGSVRPRLLSAPPIVASESMTNAPGSSTNVVEEPLTDLIRHVRFRYWGGGSWVEEWTNRTAPSGVEVTLGLDPMPEGSVPEEYPSELFRRVVFLPTGVASHPGRRGPADSPSTP